MAIREEPAEKKEEPQQSHCQTVPAKESRSAGSEQNISSGCCCGGK
jgi:hypothetical protein